MPTLLNPVYPGPNEEVLEAQSRVCTGPHQTRPLGVKPTDPQPDRILELILKTQKGELPTTEQVSRVQMGAFFAAMTLRRNFPIKTAWSKAEIVAFECHQAELEKSLPPEILYLMDPSRGYSTDNSGEQKVVEALQKILNGQHLTYTETRSACGAILNGQVAESLKAAVLIGQRMNLETYDEIRGYLDAVFSPEQVTPVNTASLTHFGEPYDGATRYFRPALFVAAVRAALGEATVLHGVDEMPPKKGITEEQILETLGANTNLTISQAAELLEEPNVGFAYLSQRMFAPGAYKARELRIHIQKRPPWSATEKAQQLLEGTGSNHMVIGYYHAGYEEPFLRLIQERGFNSGLAIKGEEGTSHFTLRLGMPSSKERQTVNFAQGFRVTDDEKESIALDVDPAAFGFQYGQNPRLGVISVQSFADAGIAALSGRKGQIYDRIVLNTALTDHLLGLCPSAPEAIRRTVEAIDSGRALAHLRSYIQRSQQLAEATFQTR